MTSERVEELRNRADLIMAWEAFEPGMEAPAPIDYEDTACKLMEAAAEIERLRGLLRDADKVVVWEHTYIRSGFQEEIEAALGIE